MSSIAIFGGTFDPIHNGHLKTSLRIQEYFKFDRYLFLPCKVPPIKPPALAHEHHRINMIKLAIKNYPDFKIDLREIERNTPSYMVDTLKSFRSEFPESSITLIMGYDSFCSLPQWHHWEQLITLANILVINRNEFAKQKQPIQIQEFLKKHQFFNKKSILTNCSGTIFLFDAGHYSFSSTKIRNKLKQKKELRAELPKEVYQYIKDEGLY
jgi:nicotinate-nucleotide adenylyltransferase